MKPHSSAKAKRKRGQRQFIVSIDVQDGMTYADIKAALASIDPTRSFGSAEPNLGEGNSYPELGMGANWQIRHKPYQRKCDYSDFQFSQVRAGQSKLKP